MASTEICKLQKYYFLHLRVSELKKNWHYIRSGSEPKFVYLKSLAPSVQEINITTDTFSKVYTNETKWRLNIFFGNMFDKSANASYLLSYE